MMQQNNITIYFILVVLALFFFGSQSMWAEESNGTRSSNEPLPGDRIRFTISLDRNSYQVSDEILLTVRFENLENWQLSPSKPSLGSTTLCRITRDGEVVEDGTKTRAMIADVRFVLHGYESRNFVFELNKSFYEKSLKRPGEYTLQCSHQYPSIGPHWGKETALISNTVEFEILPPEGENGRGERPNGEHVTDGNARDGERADSQSDDTGGAKETSLTWLLYLLIGLAVLAVLALVIYLLAARRRK